MTDAALLKRQKKEIEELRAKLTVGLVFCCHFFPISFMFDWK
jgi:hypothetical protein